MIDDPVFPQITYKRGVAGVPSPFLRGTGIRVQTIVIAFQTWELSPSAIADEYDLTETQIEEALAFYAAHHLKIEKSIATEKQLESTSG